MGDEWMQSWAQQVSELLTYFSAEIAKLSERMDSMEQRMKDSLTETQVNLETISGENAKGCSRVHSQLKEQIDTAVHREASLREELANVFGEALSMERDNRVYDISQLHGVLRTALTRAVR